jgi:hypothetical protein
MQNESENIKLSGKSFQKVQKISLLDVTILITGC